MTWLNYHHLYYFQKIAEMGSISKAAEYLRLGQPTLSIQLQSLEERLGTLFERRNRRLVLTERGQVVLKYARDIFSRGDELLRVVERGELSDQREILIGAQEGVPKAIIAATMLRLRKITKAKIMLKEGEASDLFEEVIKGHLDYIITDHEFSSKASVIYLPVGEERIAIWGKKGQFAERKKYPKDLDGAPFVYPSAGHPLRGQLEKYFLDCNVSPHSVAEVPDTALVKELGAQGYGLIALGETTVRAWVRMGRLEQFGKTDIIQKYWLGVPKKSLKDPLIEQIKEEFSV